MVRGSRPTSLLAAFCSAALLLGPGGTAAQAPDKVRDIAVDGRTVRIPLPPDSCDLDPADRRDRLLISALDSLEAAAPLPRRVARRFASCRELADWRAGKRSIAPELVEIATITSSRKFAGRGEWLRGLRDQYPVAASEQVAKSWSSAPPELVITGGPVRRSAPVLLDTDRDDRALFAALYLRLPLGGQATSFAAVATWTTAAEVPLQVLALAPYQDDGTIVRALAEEQRDLLDRLLGQNGEERRRFVRAEQAPPSDRREPTEPVYRDLLARNAGMIAVGLLSSGALLIAIGMIGSRLLRRRAV